MSDQAPPVACVNKKAEIAAAATQSFMVDSVSVFEKRLSEEVYFPSQLILVIRLENPTTAILNFKALPTKTYRRVENTEEIERALTKEGKALAELSQSCEDFQNFDAVVIEFVRRDYAGFMSYRFICRYPVS